MPSPYISVAEDVDHLTNEWLTDPKPDVIRRGSAILRRLLVEDVLGAAWRHHGFSAQPIIKAPDLLLMVGGKPEDVEVAVAGGALHGGIYAAGLTIIKGSEPAKIDDSVDRSWLTDRPWGLKGFVESAAAIVHGETVLRREVIKYFANVVGGVHLTRSSKIRKKDEEFIRRIGKLEGRIRVHVSDGLYFELLSIGQAVANSDDVKALNRAIRTE